MRLLFKILLFFCLVSNASWVAGQDFEVLDSKRSYKENGKKIRKGDRLNKEDIVIIKEKGLLTLDINYPRNLTMERGRYRLDSLIEKLKYRYARHKKFHAELKNKGLANCKFRYKAMTVPGSGNIYEADRIKISDQTYDSNKNDQNILDISWENPDKRYKGKYLVIVQEAYGQELLIDIMETADNAAFINIAKYDEQFMQYFIQAEDCRASLKMKIKQKLKKVPNTLKN